MRLRFWEEGLSRLPGGVKKYLIEKYGVSPVELDNLRCLKDRDNFAGRRVIQIKIVNPSSLDKILYTGYTEGKFLYIKREEE